ncbi:hypothetical protein BKA70DRAFT_1400837 [Coprinopsis sp. MPI-PUGE-AT-0042]|nr:hypothetical protein BKA70DRAFT_1400837 [Coprinopsis sp. MPI-PUGE-AT-0042]
MVKFRDMKQELSVIRESANGLPLPSGVPSASHQPGKSNPPSRLESLLINNQSAEGAGDDSSDSDSEDEDEKEEACGQDWEAEVIGNMEEWEITAGCLDINFKAPALREFIEKGDTAVLERQIPRPKEPGLLERTFGRHFRYL